MNALHWGVIAALIVAAPALGAEPDDQAIEVPGHVNDIYAVLKQRAVDALNNGDISGARNLLRPVANAGDAEAMRMLAQTYDPVWLTKHNVIGIDGLADPFTAAWLYVQASKQGDQGASQRVAKD